MRWRILSTAAFAVVLLFSGTVNANPASEKEQIDRELAEAESTLEGATEAAREAGRELARTEREIPKAEDRVSEAHGLVAAAQVMIKVATQAAEVARGEYDEVKAYFHETEDEVQSARETLSDLAASTYQGAGLMALANVLDADDPFQAVERMSYVEEIAARQAQALDVVLIARQEAKLAKNASAAAKEAAEEAEKAAETAYEVAQAEHESALAAEADLKELVDAQTAALATAQSEKDESLAQYERIKEESERIAAELKSRGSNDTSSKRHTSSSKLSMPVEGWKSSDFGNRYDPYYRVWQLHAGTDFAAVGGAPIRAAAPGQVVQAGWNGGYGNYTCIYHGGDMSTCYAHQSSIAVSVGQSVTAGQVIGYVGTTGASTGNHLHFEVRVAGTAVQPLEWLPPCLC